MSLPASYCLSLSVMMRILMPRLCVLMISWLRALSEMVKTQMSMLCCARAHREMIFLRQLSPGVKCAVVCIG